MLLAAPAEAQVLRIWPDTTPPCNGTLQACINGSSSGDGIEVQTDGPIDESIAIGKSLALEAGFGFEPVIGGGETQRILSLDALGSAASGESVLIRGLRFVNARIHTMVHQGSGHAITIRDNVFDFDIDHNNTPALGVDVRVPVSLAVVGNHITSTGQGMRLLAFLETGIVDFRVERNILTTSRPEQSNAGIALDLRGGGSYAIHVLSNVVRGVAGCSCGANGGIVLDVLDAAQVDASLNNNTVDETETANGILVIIRHPDASLALNLFNNSVSRSERAGFETLNVGAGTFTLQADSNNSYLNADEDTFGAQPAGTVTSFPPLYVDAAQGDLRLLPHSLLIDAGFDAPPGGTSSLDAAGASRTLGAHIDIGAYEQVPEPQAAAMTLAAIGALLALRRAAPRWSRDAARPHSSDAGRTPLPREISKR